MMTGTTPITTTAMSGLGDLLTENQAAQYAAVAINTLRKHRKAGHVAATDIRGSNDRNGRVIVTLYAKSDLDQFIKEHRKGFVYA